MVEKKKCCKNCDFKEIDQISDIICMNPKSPQYKNYVEDENSYCEFYNKDGK